MNNYITKGRNAPSKRIKPHERIDDASIAGMRTQASFIAYMQAQGRSPRYEDGGWTFYNCPFCDSGNKQNKTPAFHIQEESDGTSAFYCHSCGNGGNIFHMAMRDMGLNFDRYSYPKNWLQAVKYVSSAINNRLEYTSQTPPNAEYRKNEKISYIIPKIDITPKIERIRQQEAIYVKRCHARLINPTKDEEELAMICRRMFEERGFILQDMIRFGFGCDWEFDYTQHGGKSARTYFVKMPNGKGKWIGKFRLIIPCRCHDYWFHARLLASGDVLDALEDKKLNKLERTDFLTAKYLKPVTKGHVEGREPLFNDDVAIDDAMLNHSKNNHPVLYVVEGYLDAYAYMLSTGRFNIVATGGTSPKTLYSILEEREYHGHVIVIADNEYYEEKGKRAGINHANKVKEVLDTFDSIQCHIVWPPERKLRHFRTAKDYIPKDMNDVLMCENHKQVARYINDFELYALHGIRCEGGEEWQ